MVKDILERVVFLVMRLVRYVILTLCDHVIYRENVDILVTLVTMDLMDYL